MLREDGEHYLDYNLGDIAIATESYRGIILGHEYKIVSYNGGYKGRRVGRTWNLDVEEVLTGLKRTTIVRYLKLCPKIEGMCKDCINTCKQPDLKLCPFKEVLE